MEHNANSSSKEFADWLSDLHIKHGGVTYEVLSKRTGIPKSTISDALSGKHLPPSDKIQKLVEHIVGSRELREECRKRWAAAKKEKQAKARLVTAELADSHHAPAPSEPDSTAPPAHHTSGDPSQGTHNRSSSRVLIAGVAVFSLGIGILYGCREIQDSGRDSADSASGEVDRNMVANTHLLDQPDGGLTTVAEHDFIPSPAERKILSTPGTVGKPKYFDIVRKSADSIEVNSVTTSIMLTNERDQDIKIVNIEPDIVERGKPWSGTIFCVPPQEGVPNLQMLFDLDSPNPIARTTNEAMTEIGDPFFQSKTIDVAKKGQETLAVRATTDRHFVAFRLRVTYVINQERKEAVIDDNGRPFRVTALNETSKGTYIYGRFYAVTPEFTMREVGSGEMKKDAACAGT